jgi:DNA-binding CsgD family transcriptional regulator
VIVGRATELQRLDEIVDAARAGSAQAVLLVGEAGMGKTALLGAVERLGRRHGFRIVRAAAPEGSAELTHALVEDIVRALPEALAALDPDERALLAQVALRGAAAPGRVASALMHLLAEACTTSPVLLLLDDLHWADRASLSALVLAVGRLSTEPLVLLGAARPRPALDPRTAQWVRLDVEPLQPEAAVGMLRASMPPALAAQIPLAQAEHVVAALGHCPLVIAECTRLLSESQLTGAAALPHPIPLDERLHQAWAGTYADLPAPAREAVLSLCLVQGSGDGLLDHVLARRGGTRADLQPAIEARLVVPARLGPGQGGGPGLAHPLIRDAILACTPESVLSAEHRRVAEAARDLGLPPAVVIAHLASGGRPGDRACIECLVDEAERALADDQVVVGCRGLVAAAMLTTSAPERSHMAARAARALLERSVSLSEAWPVLAHVDESLLSPEERAWTQWLRAELIGETDVRQAAAALSAAADDAHEAGSAAEPMVLWSGVIASWMLDDGARALEQAARLERWIGSTPPEDLGAIPAWAGKVVSALSRFEVGDVAEVAPAIEAARAEAAQWRSTPATNLGLLLDVVILDQMLEATGPQVDARIAEAGRRLSGDPGETLAHVRQAQAERALRAGEVTLARALADEALDLVRTGGSRQNVALALVASVRVGCVGGAHDALIRDADELQELAGRLGCVRFGTVADQGQGMLALAEGRLDDALAHLEPLTRDLLLGTGPSDPVPMGRADLVEALVRTGDTAGAARVAADLQAVLGPSTDPVARALLDRVHGLVAPAAQAQAALERAAMAFRAAGLPVQEARTRLVLGELLRRERQTAAARRELRAVVAAFERMGAHPWLGRALGELRATGAAVPVTGPDPWSMLTPQELRVATTVAHGASNRQAASALFLSPRTVEYHLAAAYRKLGVTSRTALAHSLAQREPPSRLEGGAIRRIRAT